MGERQVIDLLRIAKSDEAHVIVAMGHHPFQVINDFDRRVVQRRLEESCHFYHCGHLHDPEFRATRSQNSSCLTVAAGAAFETRYTHNTYSIVDLDVMRSSAEIRTIQYHPSTGRFEYEARSSHQLELGASIAYSVDDLGKAIEKTWPEYRSFSYYIAALLCGFQAEVPLFANDTFTFASLAVVESQQESDLRNVTIALMHLRNILKLLSGGAAPDAFLVGHGQPIGKFGLCLSAMCKEDATIAAAMALRDSSARSLAGASSTTSFSHTAALLQDLANEKEWTALADHAKRGTDSDDPALSKLSRRMLARAQAESEEVSDVQAAALLYQGLIATDEAEVIDFASYAALSARTGDFDVAKCLVLKCISRHPDQVEGLTTIAQHLVAETGDRVFRDKFRSLLRGSNS